MISEAKKVKTFQSYEWLCHDRISQLVLEDYKRVISVASPSHNIQAATNSTYQTNELGQNHVFYEGKKIFLMSKQHDSMPKIHIYPSFVRKEKPIWRKLHSGYQDTF